MQKYLTVLAFVELLGGFILLLSKIPLLQISGGTLIFVALFEPFYEEPVSGLFYRTNTKASSSEQVKQDDNISIVGSVKVFEAPHTESTEIGQGIASGFNREVIATTSAIKELASSISKLSASTQDHSERLLNPDSIKVEISGQKLTKSEVDRTVQVVKSIYPTIKVEEEISGPVIPTINESQGDLGEFKVKLEALVKQ